MSHVPVKSALTPDEFSAAFQSLPLGFYKTTFSGKFIYATPYLVRFLGYQSLEELLNAKIRSPKFYLNRQRRRDFIKLITSKDSSEVSNFEFDLRKKDGTIAPVLMHAKLLREGSKRVFYGALQDVTELKKDESRTLDALRDISADDPYQDICDAFVKTDTEYTISYYKSYSDYLGWEFEELQGKPISKIIRDWEIRHFEDFLSDILRAPTPRGPGAQPIRTHFVTLISKNGDFAPARITAHLQRPKQSDRIGFKLFVRNISALEDGEVAFENALLARTGDVYSFRKNQYRRYTWANAEFEELILGKDSSLKQELLEKNNEELPWIPKYLAEQYRGDDELVLRTGKPIESIQRNRFLTGEETVHVVKRPVRDGEGKIVGLRGDFWRTHDHSKIEKAITSARNQDDVFNSAGVGTFYSENKTDGRFLKANDVLARVLGYESGRELISNVASIRDLYLPKEARDELLNQIKGGVVKPFQSQLIKRNGTRVTVIETDAPSSDGSGIQGMMLDISEYADRWENLEKIAEENIIRSYSETVGYLVRHEVAGPLQTIISHFEEFDGKQEVRESLKSVQHGFNLLMSNDEDREFDFSKELHGLLTRFRKENLHNADIHPPKSGKKLFLTAKKYAFLTVIRNLLHNAIVKHREPKTKEIPVNIRLEIGPESARFEILNACSNPELAVERTMQFWKAPNHAVKAGHYGLFIISRLLDPNVANLTYEVFKLDNGSKMCLTRLEFRKQKYQIKFK